MDHVQMKKIALSIIEKGEIENDYIEYKKSKEHRYGIIKTICAYCNNYMKRQYGILFIGIEELDNKVTGEKAIPKRPISRTVPSVWKRKESPSILNSTSSTVTMYIQWNPFTVPLSHFN